MSRSWISPKMLSRRKIAEILAEAVTEVAADKTAVLPGQAPSPQGSIAPAADPGIQGHPPEGTPQVVRSTPASAQSTPFKPWEPYPRNQELPSNEPSLASRTRPDLPDPSTRREQFINAYSDPSAVNQSLDRKNSGSLNVVFHGQIANGQGYIAKPHEGIGHRERFNPNEAERMNDQTFQDLKKEAPDNANRHDATYELMSAMGAQHMVTPGMQANMHLRHQFKGEDPSETDTDEKRLTMASHHAGGPAHVQEFVSDAKPLNQSSPEELNNVDAEHRLHGMVSHLLFGNGDGHSGNVMLHQSGHPVLIDHDITLGSSQGQRYKEYFGKDAIRSVFAPGAQLDYQTKLPKDEQGKAIPVGTNYPPRMKEVLQRVAEGYYDSGPGALNLSSADKAALKKNARELLSHGLEGTLERRHDIGAGIRAEKEQKLAALGGGK